MKKLVLFGAFMLTVICGYSQISVNLSSVKPIICSEGADTIITEITGGIPPYRFKIVGQKSSYQVNTMSNIVRTPVYLTETENFVINSITGGETAKVEFINNERRADNSELTITVVPTPTASFNATDYTFLPNIPLEVGLTLKTSGIISIITIDSTSSEGKGSFKLNAVEGIAQFTKVYKSNTTLEITQIEDEGCVFNTSIATTINKFEDPCIIDTVQEIFMNSACEGGEVFFELSNWKSGYIVTADVKNGKQETFTLTQRSTEILQQTLPVGDYEVEFFVKNGFNCTKTYKIQDSVTFSIFAKPIDTLGLEATQPTCSNGLTSVFTIKNTEAGYNYTTILNNELVQNKVSSGGDLSFDLDRFNPISQNSVNVEVNNDVCRVNFAETLFFDKINANAPTNFLDSMALVAIYDSLGGDNWNNATNWKSDSPINTWYGVNVACGRVVELSLSLNGLKGKIPASVGNLSDLIKLDFSDDTILGPLPNSLANLTKLEYLLLMNNQLGGNFPEFITNIKSLIELDLRDNQISGKVPQSIANLTNLNFLNLSNNNLTDTLPVLDFMGGDVPVVDISGNRFTFISIIPNSKLGIWESFQYRFQANIGKSIDTLVKEGTKLILTVNEPKVNGTRYQWYESLGEGSRKLDGDTLESLIFEQIKSNDESEFGYYCILTNPELPNFQLYTESFAVRVCRNPSREDSLKLVAIFNATNGSNWINKTNWLTVAPIDQWYGIKTDCEQIVEINLSNNNLLDSLPPQIDSLYFLERLDLHGNKLNNKNIANILTSKFGLNYFDISNNQFSGNFPNVFSKGSEIEHLNISNNNFSGAIPDVFEGFYKIRYFNVDSNNFIGALPTSIAQDSLEELYIGNNQFTDTLSSRLFFAKRLKVFDANTNRLRGKLPNDFSGWDSIKVIVLSNNRLSGAMGTGLFKLNKLEVLNLGSNDLSDTISSDLSNLNKLQTLNLESNSFTGKIPSNIGLLSALQTLNLNFNNLSSSLPISIGSLKNLVSLKITGNSLTGKIPASMGDMANLEVLQMGNNLLEDSVPNSFTNLQKMKDLDLYNNQLTYIPNLKSIKSLEALYVALNKLTFEHLEPNVGISTFQYFPQDSVLNREVLKLSNKQPMNLLSSIGGSANVYQWSKDNILINGANLANYYKPNAVKADTGTYTCTITNPNLPLLTLFRRPIEVIACDPSIPTPSVKVIDSTSCLSKTLKGPSGYQKYEWYLDVYKLSSANDSVFKAIQNGTYRLAIEDNTQCKAFSETKLVNIFGNLAIPQLDQSKLQSDKILSSTSVFPYYQWYVNGKLIVGAKSQSLPIYYNGIYSLEIGSLDSCKLSSKELVVRLNGLPDIAKADFYSNEGKQVIIPFYSSELAKVYPNPSEGIVTLDLPEGENSAELVICDLRGKLLKTFDITSTKNFIKTDLNAGIYIFKITISGNTQWEKIVIE